MRYFRLFKSVKCKNTVVVFWRWPQQRLCFSCCKAGFPHQHFKGNKGSCKPCKVTTETPASHNEMTLQCCWGWGAALIPDGLPPLQKFPLWISQPLGIYRKSLSNYAYVFGEPIQSRNLTCTYSHHSGKYTRRVRLLRTKAWKLIRRHAWWFRRWVDQSSSSQSRFCHVWCLQKSRFYSGQYSVGFTQHLSLPLKTKQFRKHAANTDAQEMPWLFADNRDWAGRVYCPAAEHGHCVKKPTTGDRHAPNFNHRRSSSTDLSLCLVSSLLEDFKEVVLWLLSRLKHLISGCFCVNFSMLNGSAHHRHVSAVIVWMGTLALAFSPWQHSVLFFCLLQSSTFEILHLMYIFLIVWIYVFWLQCYVSIA